MAATVTTDVVAITIMVAVGYKLGLGTYVPQFGDISPGVGVVAGVLIFFALVVCRAWDPRVIGQGSEEFSRVIRAVVTSAVALGLLGLGMQALAPRPWVFGLMPMGGVLAIVFRLALRSHLHKLRARGRCALPVLAVGAIESVSDLIDRTRRDTNRGWTVTGVCTPTGAPPDGESGILGVPVLGDLDSVADVAGSNRHRVVAVCPTPAGPRAACTTSRGTWKVPPPRWSSTRA